MMLGNSGDFFHAVGGWVVRQRLSHLPAGTTGTWVVIERPGLSVVT